MADYRYEGNMAAYFLITFLALILIPLTLSISPSKREVTSGCQCQPCIDQRARIRKREVGSWLNPKFSAKTIVIAVGWSLFAYLAYNVTNAKIENKVYDPFEILGLRSGVTEKEIKSHFKKLSRLYHPDKVKATANDTIESIANKFVDITKAYKSLTDENIRKNWEIYGHPDGRQEIAVGIALPQWIVEGKNNIWVLGFYGLIFGGALPALVGRWWFGSRQKTKDGVHARTASSFFKSLREESEMTDVVGMLGTAFRYENILSTKTPQQKELEDLEIKIQETLSSLLWKEVSKLAGPSPINKTALVLLYAHLLRIPIKSSLLRTEQSSVLLRTSTLLNALLTITTSRSWLLPTLAVMRFHAYLAQALLPGNEKLRYAQLPLIQSDEVSSLPPITQKLEDLVAALEKSGDKRVDEVKKAVETWGRLELVEASFKVIGERLITPSSIVFLVVKLRLSPPTSSPASLPEELDVDEMKRRIKINDEKDNQFLSSRKEAEDLPSPEAANGWAHAPYWPGNRKPAWWLTLADGKTNKIIMPPIKITDIPFSNLINQDRNYRSYKLQFQAPQGVGLFTWKVCLISDTYVGEEIYNDLTLKIDDVSALNADEQQAEDEISDPDEDTIAGQMAAMRGGSVKKRQDEDSDEESSTDDDQASSSDSDSD